MVVPFTRFGRVAFGAALLVTMAGAAAAQDEWQAEWAKTVAAAKAEGQVVVNLSPSPARRDFLLKQWKEDYPEIELSLSIVSGSGFVPAVVTERMAGKYLWDVWHAGPNYEAIRAGLLDPLLPELIFPRSRTPMSGVAGTMPSTMTTRHSRSACSTNWRRPTTMPVRSPRKR